MAELYMSFSTLVFTSTCFVISLMYTQCCVSFNILLLNVLLHVIVQWYVCFSALVLHLIVLLHVHYCTLVHIISNTGVNFTYLTVLETIL
jgi:hypothetical protein